MNGPDCTVDERNVLRAIKTGESQPAVFGPLIGIPDEQMNALVSSLRGKGYLEPPRGPEWDPLEFLILAEKGRTFRGLTISGPHVEKRRGRA